MSTSTLPVSKHHLYESQVLHVCGLRVRIVRLEGGMAHLNPDGWGNTIPVLIDRLLEEILSSN